MTAIAQTLKLIYGVDRDSVTTEAAQAGASLTDFQPAPMYPPLDWFTDEAADNAPPKLRVFPGGRVAGVVAPAGRCLLDGTGTCWKVPRPDDGRGSILHAPDVDDHGDYRMAHVGETVLESGATIATAVIAGPGGHADPYATIRQARSHYDNTAFQVAQGRYVWSDRAGGLCFVGALNPEVDERQLRSIRASAASIDYRWVNDEACYRLIATCLVNVGGLPSRYAAAADDGFVLTEGRIWSIAQELGLDKPAMAAAAASDPVTIDDLFFAIVAGVADDSPEPADGEVPSEHVSTPEEPMTDTAVLEPGTEAPAAEAPATPAAPAPCADCGDQAVPDAAAPAPEAHTAAYAVESIPTEATLTGPSASPNLVSGDQVTFGAGQLGMFSNTIAGPGGETYLMVFLEDGGTLDLDEPIVLPAADATATGKLYRWVEPSELPLDTMVVGGEEPPAEEAMEPAESDDEAPAMVASLGQLILAGRVPMAGAVTHEEHRIGQVESAVQAAVAAVQAEADRRLEALTEQNGKILEQNQALTAAVSSLVDAVGGIHKKDLADSILSLG